MSLPYALAGLSWIAGMIILLVSAVSALFCAILLAKLHHHDDRRHIRYRDLSSHILGKHKMYSGAVVCVFQYLASFGIGVANIILSAQMINAIWALYCGNTCSTMHPTYWTIITGAVCLLLSTLVPDLAAMDLVVLFGGMFTVVYTVIALVLTFQQADDILGGQPPSYDLQGSSANKAFTFLNSIGIIMFAFGNSIVPEMQATLGLEPNTLSSERPMIIGMSVSFAAIIANYTLVTVVGYYKFGAAAPGFLLTPFTHPAWAVTLANALCIFQMLAAFYVYVFPLYEAVETKVLKRTRVPWVRRVSEDAKAGTRTVSPSFFLRLLVRGPFVVVFTVIAAAIPFFTSIMGFLGAIGFTPLTYVLPAALYLEAKGDGLQRWQWWGLFSFAVVFTVLGLGAAVGSLRTIIVTASTFTFFP